GGLSRVHPRDLFRALSWNNKGTKSSPLEWISHEHAPVTRNHALHGIACADRDWCCGAALAACRQRRRSSGSRSRNAFVRCYCIGSVVLDQWLAGTVRFRLRQEAQETKIQF